MELPEATAIIKHRVADVVGGVMELWGFKSILGRLWALLYLSEEPQSAAQLREQLSASVGAISMSLNELQKWGVVRKIWRPGERRDYYECETSIWKMISRVFRERELVRVRDAIEAFESAKRQLDYARTKATAAEKRHLKFIETQIDALLALSRTGEKLLTMLIEGKAIDPRPVMKLIIGR
jgi:DNA-binding transcriptional regulator GbsR (MarR family)